MQHIDNQLLLVVGFRYLVLRCKWCVAAFQQDVFRTELVNRRSQLLQAVKIFNPDCRLTSFLHDQVGFGNVGRQNEGLGQELLAQRLDSMLG